jgi:alpha-L-rhamnosidase
MQKRGDHNKPHEMPGHLSQASWLWPQLGFHHLHNGYARFRRVITLDAVPRKAPAWITADQCYHLRVNGRLVCRGPARGFQESWPFDEVDLAPFLRKGRNVIAIRAYNAGHSTFGYRSEGFAGVLFAAKIGKLLLVSDADWKCRRESGTRRDTWPYSLQLPGHQESIDLREEDPDWEKSGFDDTRWGTSEELRRWNAPPYMTLEPRGIPMLRECTLKPKLMGAGGGRSRSGWRTAEDIGGLRFSESLRHSAVEATRSAFRVPSTPRGQFRSYVLDFGHVVVGSPRLAIKNARGGEAIDLLHVEAIDPKRLAPHVDLNDHCRVRLANRLVCRKGNQTHTFFHHLGFRFMVLTVRENLGPLDVSVELAACGYPMEGAGSFRCDDPELNRIWQVCAHTQRICALDAYVDTPWREQAQWWGDARIQAWNTYHLCADPRLLRRGIRTLAGQTTPDGLTYGHAPTMAHNCILPDFSLIWTLTLWDDYWQTGETTMLENHHARVSTILDYFRRHTDPQTGLIRFDPRYWLFLDWTDIQKDGQPALLALWLLEALRKLEVLLKASSLPATFEGVPAWRRTLESDICKYLLDRDGLICDGLDDRGKRSSKKSLQAQTLAWMCGLPGFDKDRALEKILLPWLREDRITHARPSSYWCAYPLELLARAGHGAEVLAFIKRHWRAMAEYGSCFENFDPMPDGSIISHSHAWSAHPLYLFMQILGGIRQTAPGWKSVSIDPVFAGKEASVTVPTPRGNIHVSWTKGADATPRTKIQVPPGIKKTSRISASPAAC